jgi:tetratricopeptide (TPR) repeat protein
MKKLIIFSFLSILAVHVFPCTMFRLTVNGKTLVGNNEDFSYPFSRMWTVPAENGKYGMLYFGFDNGFPQGGMNEKGLVFDGFSMPYRKVKNIEGKEKIDGRELFHRVMSECATVEEVEALVLQFDLSFLFNAQLMFADANGHSMILEGDDILISEGPYQIATNFYQSSIQNTGEITCWRFRTADRLLGRNPQPTVEFCKTVLDSVHPEGYWGGTQYSNVYDPVNTIVTLYLFHNFKEAVTIDLKEVLEKGEFMTPLEDLFHDTSVYKQYTQNYMECQDLLAQLPREKDFKIFQDIIVRLKDNEQTRLFVDRLSRMGERFLKRNETKKAIGIFQLVTAHYPDTWQAYKSLADCYMQVNEKEKALACIRRALELRPDDEVLKTVLRELEGRRE